jgi:hypothetical protein
MTTGQESLYCSAYNPGQKITHTGEIREPVKASVEEMVLPIMMVVPA